MIIAALAGGMGNQMFIYATGLALAIRHGQPLYLDMNYFENLPYLHTPRKFELGRFNISGQAVGKAQKIRAVASRIYPMVGWKGRVIRRLPFPPLMLIEDAQKSYDPRIASAPKNAFLSGPWQTEKYFAHIRSRLLEEFTFKSSPTPENARMIEQIRAETSVCVHVRRSDFLLPYSMAQPIPNSYYDRALEMMAAKVPHANYFVFSDDSPWAQANLRWPADTVFITHNTGRDDGEDLRLMSHCDHFIIANSTFSWWGAWLSRAEGKIVIGPRNWYPTPHPSEADLIPESWIRV